MVAILSLLLIMGISLMVIRVASVALEHTGLGRDSARFQARSAYTGVGFTTSEAEDLVNHPVRRRIVMWLMLVGNVGIVSAMAALLISAIDLRSAQSVGFLAALLLGGVALLWALGSSQLIDRHVCRVIRWAIDRFTDLDSWDYARLLHLHDEYGVSRFRVQEGDWVGRKTLREAAVGLEGVLILGIECPGGSFVGVPPPDVEVRIGDELVVYGDVDSSSQLRTRAAGEDGDRAHTEAVAEHSKRILEQRKRAGR